MTKFATHVAAAALAIAVAAPAAAQDIGPLSREVRYGDLDLSTSSGVKELNRRIRSAAREVCLYEQAGRRAPNPVVQRCLRTAMSKANAEVNQAVASAGTGKPGA